jgi:hypothetical protein
MRVITGAALAALLFAAPASADMTTYTYTTIDPPGSIYTIAESINDSGQIAGFYQDSNRVEHGFLDSGGSYTTIDPPGSIETIAESINDSGQIVGVYYDTTYVTGAQGFRYSGGIYTTIDPPGSHRIDHISINASGQIVRGLRRQ